MYETVMLVVTFWGGLGIMLLILWGASKINMRRYKKMEKNHEMHVKKGKRG